MIFYFFGFSAWTKVGDFTKTNITGTAATKETETDSEPVKGIEITTILLLFLPIFQSRKLITTYVKKTWKVILYLFYR